MSVIARGLRSEPTIEARFQRLAKAARDPKRASKLPRMSLDSKEWESDWSFLLWVGPEAAGDYLAATSQGVEDPYDTYRRLLSDERVYGSSSIIRFILDYFQSEADNPFEFSAIVAGGAKVLIKTLANPQQAAPEHWDTLNLLVERYNLGQRHDLFSSNKNLAHLIVDVLLDAEVEQILMPGSGDEFDAPLRELANRLFSLVCQSGGTLEHTARVPVGKDITAVLSPLLVVARAYENGKGGEVLMNALIDAGADWNRALDKVGPSSRELIESHPRVKSQRLMEVAQNRTMSPGGRKL